MTTTDKPSIAELQRTIDAANDGPWLQEGSEVRGMSDDICDCAFDATPDGQAWSKVIADASCIAALRNAAPVLLEIAAAALAWDAAEAPTPEGDHAYQCFMAALAKVLP